MRQFPTRDQNDTNITSGHRMALTMIEAHIALSAIKGPEMTM